MKTGIFLFFISALFFASCSKSNSTIVQNKSPQPTYLDTTSGSTWTYNKLDSSGTTPTNTTYTVTATSNDTSITYSGVALNYHVYSYSYGGSEYLNITGHNYYEFDSIPGTLGDIFSRLYLEDNAAVGANWSQNLSVTIEVLGIPYTIPFTVTNTVVGTGLSMTVNSINYANVIHVSTSISSGLIPATALTSSIDSYYAQNYGLIQSAYLVNLNYQGVTENVNTRTQLISSALK